MLIETEGEGASELCLHNVANKESLCYDIIEGSPSLELWECEGVPALPVPMAVSAANQEEPEHNSDCHVGKTSQLIVLQETGQE
jgi:hypothetical protein